ncbi:MAG TPA: TIGR03564 family F420-dependent LLM class oxidoreductase [Actinopolymorphaceae bacterium]
MQVGLWVEGQLGSPVDEVLRQVRHAAELGYHRVWLGEVGGWDPLSLIGVLGQHVPGIGLGTSIVRTYARHPLALAAEALTVQAATGSRLTLGVGPSHASIIEGQYGLSFEAPARNTREYLSILTPLLHGRSVSYHGRHWSAVGEIGVAEAVAPPVFVAALGPAMLKLAGEQADGAITAWAGPGMIADLVRPALGQAAAAAGRPAPGVVACVCVCVTSTPSEARERVDRTFAAAGELPSYRRVLDLQGLATPGETVVAGDEAAVERALREFEAAGATEVYVVPVGTPEEKQRTLAVCGALASALASSSDATPAGAGPGV